MTQQPQDLLNRFTTRSRPTIERGDDEVTSAIRKVDSPGAEPSVSLVKSSPSSSQVQKLTKQDEVFPDIEQLTLRVEVPIKEAIQEYARRSKVTPECLFQGLWKVAKDNPVFLEQATELARESRKLRQRIGTQKKALNQIKQFQDG